MSRDTLWGPEYDVPTGRRPVDPPPRGRARKTDPATSAEAAESITVAAETQALTLLRTYGPLADFELVAKAPKAWFGPTLVLARRRLVKRHLVKATNHRRRTTRNRDAIVWEAVA